MKFALVMTIVGSVFLLGANLFWGELTPDPVPAEKPVATQDAKRALT